MYLNRTSEINFSPYILFALTALVVGFSFLWGSHYIVGILFLLFDLFCIPLSVYQDNISITSKTKKILIIIFYLGMSLLILFDLYTFTYKNWILSKDTVETTATIEQKNSESCRRGCSYFLLLKYTDVRNVTFTNRVQVFHDEYYRVKINDSMPIVYSNENPKIMIIPSFTNTLDIVKDIFQIVVISVFFWIGLRLFFRIGLKS